MKTRVQGIEFLTFLAVTLLVALSLTGIALVTGAVACGEWPEARHPFAGLVFLFGQDQTLFTGCGIPSPAFQIASAVAAALVMVLVIVVLLKVAQYRKSDAYFRAQLLKREGFAESAEISKYLSAKSVLKRARYLRPSLGKPRPSDVGWRVGLSRRLSVYISIEDSLLVEGAPRVGKGFRILINAILDWSGPLITTSTTNDNLTATIRQRQKVGEVYVFDPQGLSGIRSTLRISPIDGCRDPLVAVQRANAIITGSASGQSTSNQEWRHAASVALSLLLHAAAVGNRTVADLFDWGSSPGTAKVAVEILREHGAPGWSEALDATLSSEPKILASVWMGVQAAVAPLAIPQIRDALQPRPGEAIFDAARFLDGSNTLYLIGSSAGSTAMGGFLAAILDDVVEVARRRALASPNSRLEQPLGLILDEIANMFQWNNLPKVMADGGGRGICTLVVLQAISQAETAWSRAEAATIWAAATAKILLGGATQAAHLQDVENLLGTREVRKEQTSYSTQRRGLNVSEQSERLPLMSIDEIRRMPNTLGLLTYRSVRPVLLDLTGWDERADAKAVIAGKRDVEAEQRDVFAAMYNQPSVPLQPYAPGDE